jgi:hypothetical protein
VATLSPMGAFAAKAGYGSCPIRHISSLNLDHISIVIDTAKKLSRRGRTRSKSDDSNGSGPFASGPVDALKSDVSNIISLISMLYL